MITSRNRSDDLRRTLNRLGKMTPLADEIIVTADGCSDGTVAMIGSQFPHCSLLVNEPGQGSIYSRDQMLRMASGDLVVSLDDDSYPVDDDFFDKLNPLFAAHPEAAVITFPELRDDETFVPAFKSPQTPGHYVSAYPNGAAVMRRADYLKTSGFPAFFSHAYEEPDYALQSYDHGKAVWFEPSLVIRHHLSKTNRDNLRTHHLNARNELWSVWMRCPWPWLPLVTLYRVLRQFCYAYSEGLSWVVREPQWWRDAVQGLDACRKARNPIPWQTYVSWMRLARRPLFQLSHLEAAFGVMLGSRSKVQD
ncbi:MAG: glycosyltransferase [Prosthecobacter sp.]